MLCIQKTYASIVKRELLETLLVNQKLSKIIDKSQTKTAFQSATQKENSNKKYIDQFAQTENQCTVVFPTEIDDVESIRYIEKDDDFQLHICVT